MKISAVVVTYNPDIETLLEQFNSVYSQVDNVIYIDNGSSNYEELKLHIASLNDQNMIFMIHNKVNMGLGYAHNQGIRQSEELGSSAVLILDHDSVLRCSFVDELTKALECLCSNNEKVAAVGPIYINESTNEQYPITRYFGPFIKRLKPSSYPVEASVLISSGSLIPIEVLHKIGGMDEKLFVDYIDIEWSYRARSHGYKLYAIPTAVMNHQIGDKRASIFGRMVSIHSPLRRYYLSRNSIYMLRCPYVSWGYKVRELIFNMLRVIVFTLISHDRLKYLKYSFRGVFDGIKGKFGKCPF